MADGVLPGGLRQRAVQLALQQQRPTDMSAMMAPGSIAGQVAAGTAMSPLSLRTMALRGATRPRTQAEVLRAYGLGAPSKLPQPDVAAPTSTGIADTVAGYLPETGTPEMAGLGAAGRTMMQLGGWQDQPYTLGQILGAGAEKGLEAMKARQDAMTAAAEKKAKAEQDAKKFALEEKYRLAQISKMEREAKGVTGKALPWKTQSVIDPETKERGKADVAYLPLGDPMIEILGGDPKTGRVVRKGSFISDATETSKRFQNLGPYMHDGKFIGEGQLDTATGKRTIVGTNEDIPTGAYPVTESALSTGIPNATKFSDLGDEIFELEQGLRKYVKYLGDVDKAPEGIERLSTRLMADFKTVFSFMMEKNNLTEAELSQRLAEGRLQGLIGASRLETVGGGVMTEQDALRIIQNLGGDVADLTANKQVIKEQISYLFGEKYRNYDRLVDRYNRYVDIYYKDKKVKPKTRLAFDTRYISQSVLEDVGLGGGAGGAGDAGSVDISVAPDGFPPADWAALDEADRRAYLAAGN